MTQDTGARPPLPQSISEEARGVLAAPSPLPDYPALDDTQAWLDRVKETDEMIVQGTGSVTLPVQAEQTEIGGVSTYVLKADGVADDERTPIYLDIHGGALLFGGGEACRLMPGPNALTTGMINWAVDYRMPPLHPYPAPLDDCLASTGLCSKCVTRRTSSSVAVRPAATSPQP